MTEAIKSVIWKKGEDTINGKKVYKYLIGAILVTDQPIDGITSGDNVAMAQIPTDLNMLTNAFSTLPKYKPPYNLGDLSTAMLDIANLTPNDMKQEDEDESST